MPRRPELEDLERRNALAEQAGGAERVARQRRSHKLTARDRIDALLDPNSFIEIGKLVGARSDVAPSVPGDGVVAGTGRIDGREVAVFAQDFTVVGGSLSEANARKICQLMDLAVRAKLPVVGLKDSVGGRILEAMGPLAGYGNVFHKNCQLSGVVPQISAVMGPCAGGAAYSPALTDFVFMVRDTSHMFITGPDVLHAVTREEATKDELGGWHTHATITGVAHFAVDNDHAALTGIRTLLSYLPSSNEEDPPRGVGPAVADPSAAPIDGIIPDKPSAMYDVRDVVRAVVDSSTWFEVHELFAANIVTGFARIDGRTVGIVANQPAVLAGCIDADASRKASRFVRFCDCFNVPILTLVDVPGFLPGKNQETSGIIVHGAKLLYAYSEASVPKVTVILRKAYGGAYDAMGSRHLGADVVLALPSAEIAVMGAEAAVAVLNRAEVAQAEDPAALRAALVSDYRDRFNHPYLAASRGMVDDVISPHNLRASLIRYLDVLRDKVVAPPKRKHGNIPL